MSSLSQEPSFVSLEDSDATRDELQALIAIMRSDQPYADECPELDEPYIPDDADVQWWAEFTSVAPVESHKLLAHVHVSPSLSISLTETERPQGDEGRYVLRSYKGGVQVAVQAHDSLSSAQAMLWHMTTPLQIEGGPRDGEWVLPGETGLSDDATDAMSGWTGGAAW